MELGVQKPSMSTSDGPPPDPNQTDGYLVVLRPEPAHRRRLARVDALSGASNAVRAVVPDLDPRGYCGIERDAIDRWQDGEGSWEDRHRNVRARRRIRELYGPDPTCYWTQPPWFDADLLPTLEVAREIFSLVDDPSERELVRVNRTTESITPRTLGFDVGYWGSDHFSAILNSIVSPHPRLDPVPLVPWAGRLNRHLLLPTAVAAHEYRAWYVSQPWGETETTPGEFHVIRVEAAD